MDVTQPTRGELNNNPGNINYSINSPFKGQIGIEDVPFGKSYAPRFGKYDCAQNGIRAIAKILITYITKDGANTIAKAISRWAPGIENNTQAYIDDVAEQAGESPDFVLTITVGNLLVLCKAIIRHENGRCNYTDDLITAAIQDAMVPSNPHGVQV